MNRLKADVVRWLGLLASCLAASTAGAQDNRQLSDAKVVAVYVHECCGRPPYVAAVLDKTLTAGSCGDPKVIAAPIAWPLAKYLYATALAAKNTGTLVDVWYSESCDATVAFRTWIGIYQK